MSLDDVVKDIGEIYSRLFDHHPFVGGEIKYFQKEFEEDRGDREVEQLFQILEQVTEIRENSTDKAITLSDKHLCNISTNFDVALGMCNKILEGEAVDKTNYLGEQRHKRKLEWSAFTHDVSDKQNRVDAAFKQKEDELRSYYADLEEKLHIIV